MTGPGRGSAGGGPGEDPLEDLRRDPDLARTGAYVRAELRAEAEEYEALAAKDLARSRTLRDVAMSACHRGDLVEVLVASGRFVGRVVAAAGDLASLETATEAVDVWLRAPLALRVVERARSGGRSTGGGAASFKARLAEHEASGVPLVVGTRLPPGELHGVIAAVAVDHVVLEDRGTARHVALAAVDLVHHPLG